MRRAIVLPLLLALSTCGLLDPEQDPFEILPRRTLSPQVIAISEAYVAAPDSGGGTPAPTVLRFTLSSAGRTAVNAGGVVESVLPVPAGGGVKLEGARAADGSWIDLLDEIVPGSGTADLWWQGAWAQPVSATLVDAQGQVRLRTSALSEGSPIRLRVVTPAPGLHVWTAGRGPMTVSGDQLFIQTGGWLEVYSPLGLLTGVLSSPQPPAAIARAGGFFYGVTATDLRRMSSEGGGWIGSGSLPAWGPHGGVALTSDGADLFLIRHSDPGTSGEFPVLFRLDPGTLNATANFSLALRDSTRLRRAGMTGGTGATLAWWSQARVLVATGIQDGEWGLLTFSRAGRFLRFIPLPFEPAADLRLAFSGSFLFIGNARPTLAALAWSDPHTPVGPKGTLIFRWAAP